MNKDIYVLLFSLSSKKNTAMQFHDP